MILRVWRCTLELSKCTEVKPHIDSGCTYEVWGIRCNRCGEQFSLDEMTIEQAWRINGWWVFDGGNIASCPKHKTEKMRENERHGSLHRDDPAAW